MFPLKLGCVSPSAQLMLPLVICPATSRAVQPVLLKALLEDVQEPLPLRRLNGPGGLTQVSPQHQQIQQGTRG